MPTARRLSLLLVAATLTSLGCHAQNPSQIAGPVIGQPLSPALEHRVEVVLRQKASLPPNSTILVGPPAASEFPGYTLIAVTISNSGNVSHPISFLLSTDGKTLAQLSKYDISASPRAFLSADGRPSRGGPPTAPVIIVGFDDLECSFCALLHNSIFPAILQRYGDNVRIVYKDYPLDIHPWAMRAAVDVNCLADQSPSGYWNLVDYIHAHASAIGADPSLPADDPKARTVDRANHDLDKLTAEQGKVQKVDESKLNACIAKQDTAAVEASKALGTGLNIEATPTLYINGAKSDGAVPIEFIYHMIDDALRAENVTPPPPYVSPAPAADPAADPAKPVAADPTKPPASR